jgi:hypothetical protein
MRDDYKIHGATAKVQLDVEKSVAEKLQMMEKFTKLSQSEIANTALKRFITQHKDFLPTPEEEAKFR